MNIKPVPENRNPSLDLPPKKTGLKKKKPTTEEVQTSFSDVLKKVIEKGNPNQDK